VGVFLTGPPGSGKSYLGRQVIAALRSSGVTVAACGASRVTAGIIGGGTVHSWAGFIHGNADGSASLSVVVEQVLPPAAKDRMPSATVLVIDEIGTVSADFVARLDDVLRAVRGADQSFGGMVPLFLGDFLQLPLTRGSFAFTAAVWGEVPLDRAVVLETNWRHVNDSQLLSLLLRVRVGTHTVSELKLLAGRRTDNPPPSAVWFVPQSITAVAKIEEELAKLGGLVVDYQALDVAIAPYLSKEVATALVNDTSKLLSWLRLRMGARVVVPNNSFANDGVPAGSRGEVVDFF